MSLTPSNPQVYNDLRSKSNARAFARNFFRKRSPLSLSFILHAATAFTGLTIAFFPTLRSSHVEIEIVDAPKAPSKTMTVAKAPPKTPPKVQPRAVFGLSRRSITSDQGETVKAGNTVAKEVDDTKLKPSDADALPVPIDEYLVNRMPELLSEVRVPYPPEAKKNKVTGAVVMDILIDAQGTVRDAKLISGPSEELSAAALAAVVGFKFKPAIVQDKPVAVRIRYAYRFVLEN